MLQRIRQRSSGSDSEYSSDSNAELGKEWEGQSASDVNSPIAGGLESSPGLEEEDLKEYAKSLGLNLDVDSDLAWLVREAFVAPLPASWSEHADGDSGKVFFFNQVSQESHWCHPTDEIYKDVIALVRGLRAERLPATRSEARRLQAIQEHLTAAHAAALDGLEGWSGPYDSDAGAYFYNRIHDISTWENPVAELEEELALRQRILHSCLLRDVHRGSQATSSAALHPSGGYQHGSFPAAEVSMPRLPLRVAGPSNAGDSTPKSPSSARSFCTARSGCSARSARSVTPPPRHRAQKAASPRQQSRFGQGFSMEDSPVVLHSGRERSLSRETPNTKAPQSQDSLTQPATQSQSSGALRLEAPVATADTPIAKVATEAGQTEVAGAGSPRPDPSAEVGALAKPTEAAATSQGSAVPRLDSAPQAATTPISEVLRLDASTKAEDTPPVTMEPAGESESPTVLRLDDPAGLPENTLAADNAVDTDEGAQHGIVQREEAADAAPDELLLAENDTSQDPAAVAAYTFGLRDTSPCRERPEAAAPEEPCQQPELPSEAANNAPAGKVDEAEEGDDAFEFSFATGSKLELPQFGK